MSDKEQRIREIAYFIWEEEGRPDGLADQHWRSAEAIVKSLESGDSAGGEPAKDAPADYMTPLSALTRGPSSEGAGRSAKSAGR